MKRTFTTTKVVFPNANTHSEPHIVSRKRIIDAGLQEFTQLILNSDSSQKNSLLQRTTTKTKNKNKGFESRWLIMHNLKKNLENCRGISPAICNACHLPISARHDSIIIVKQKPRKYRFGHTCWNPRLTSQEYYQKYSITGAHSAATPLKRSSMKCKISSEIDVTCMQKLGAWQGPRL